MKTYALYDISDNCQKDLYIGLNKFSKSYPNWGRICAVPVSVADVALEVLKVPLMAVENAALVPINLVGSALSICNFKNLCTLKDSLTCAERALSNAVSIPVVIFMAVPKLAFQFSAIVINPRTVRSVSYFLDLIKFDARQISREHQDELYFSLNRFSISHPNWGRVCAIPISILDIALDTSCIPLLAIACAAGAVINLIGSVLSLGYSFEKSYTLGHSLICAERALNCAVVTPVAIFMAIPKLAFQFSAIVIDPKTVQSIRFNKPIYLS